ncbi:hypothetical protein GOODEAATRI_017372 [Goodea atripinnis]|uniref:Uncharacterized protein n=1 Tax=Goodea atripinnis TaxID=208336 RepID=A0ABV0P5M9_9TELE
MKLRMRTGPLASLRGRCSVSGSCPSRRLEAGKSPPHSVEHLHQPAPKSCHSVRRRPYVEVYKGLEML